MNIPEGWKASLNLAKNSVTVQAPAASDAAYSGGIITLIGIDKKGDTVFASADVCASVDYTDKDGTFVVCEGNMTSVNGMLVYYDKAGKEYREVFEQANGGLEIGNVVQDMFMANGKIYLLTQNGDRMAAQAVSLCAMPGRCAWNSPTRWYLKPPKTKTHGLSIWSL